MKNKVKDSTEKRQELIKAINKKVGLRMAYMFHLEDQNVKQLQETLHYLEIVEKNKEQ